ncbi:uncharacterized protein BDCG_05612 [Blastomyces dermatitidis ER-3]|uniref:Ankyrin repeat protein n=1 Tax=Ajellomyces dermatitidis (strain ER-3 / ATCC MYA-2586) TaxID=559297 RepID=A0ABM9YI96_AJEDR|nr:uncharacterized protein BDCG_05612 [Blastomyces dermatitidis ER-3]EEQ90492.1 hypothetical protein BDCG_05612 [Blastomyces dermatitidis ER-3]
MSRLRPSSQDEVGAVLSCVLKYNFSGYLGLLGQAIRAGGEMAWGEDARCPRQNFSTARPQQDAAVIILGPSFIQTSKPPFRYKLTSRFVLCDSIVFWQYPVDFYQRSLRIIDKKSDRRKPYSSTSPAFSEEASRKTSLLASVKSRNISAVRKFLKTSPGHLTPETYIITLQTAISLGDHAILELLLTSRPPSYPLPLDNKIYINSLLATSFDGKFSISTSQITQKTKHPSNPTSPSSLKQPPSAAAPTSSYPSCPTTTTALTTLPPLPTHTISFPPSAPQQHKAIRTSSAISSLAAASFKGHTEIVGLLLRHNADPNARGYQFGSALQAAALQGHAEIVRLLVDGGADVGLEGGKYGTALKAARHRGHEEVVRVLVEGVKTVDEDGSARRG